jgi:hypothetical protein
MKSTPDMRRPRPRHDTRNEATKQKQQIKLTTIRPAIENALAVTLAGVALAFVVIGCIADSLATETGVTSAEVARNVR